MSRRLTVSAPATTANLGPGFDSLALTLDLRCVYRVTVHSRTSGAWDIDVQGPAAAGVPTGPDNLFIRGLQAAAQAAGTPLRGGRVTIEQHIPVARGLGSSAAALTAGLCAGSAAAEGDLDRGEMLQLAAGIEGHADNASACLNGGLTAALAPAASSVPLSLDPGWWALVVVPDVSLRTADARRCLPEMVARRDAAFNIARALAVAQGLAAGDGTVLKRGLADRLHQEPRLAAVPGLGDLYQRLTRWTGGRCAVSGAGPSLISFYHGTGKAPPEEADALASRVEDAADSLPWTVTCRLVKAGVRGVSVTAEDG